MNLAVFYKEARSISRERTFITTILLQVFLILFYSLAILGIYIIMNPYGQYGTIDVLVVQNEFLDMDFVRLMDGFDVQIGPRDTGEHDAVLEFTDSDPAILYVYTRGKGFRASYVIAELKDVLKRYENLKKRESLGIVTSSDLDAGISTSRLSISSLVFEFRYFLLVPLLMFLPIYLSAVLFIDLFTEEIANKTLVLLKAAPVSMAWVIAQKMLAALLLSMAQAIAWVVILEFRHIHIRNPLPMLGLLFLANVAIILFAGVVSINFRDRSVSQVILSFVVVALLVTKSFSFNTLNLVTKLAVIDLPLSQMLLHAAMLICIIAALSVAVAISARRLAES